MKHRHVFMFLACGITMSVAPWRAFGGEADDVLCEMTGGTWDPLACGHYYCGFPQECGAVIPGCDCGPGANFEEGQGCVSDPACGELWPVQVAVDMDAVTPGVQAAVTVSTCTSTLEDVSVYITDPLEQRSVWAIGYLGGLDRGISFGHTPGQHAGVVLDLIGSPHTPVNPSGSGWVTHTPYMDPGFAGPEVQYFEYGATTPAVIPAEPAGPAFTVDIVLDNLTPGDHLNFFLLDFVSVWTGGANGAFSAIGPYTLDSGGDALPDGTSTIYGMDPDVPIAVPPATYLIDYIDGPAVIQVSAESGDFDADGVVGASDLALLLGNWGACPPPSPCAFDLTADGWVNAADLAILLANWGGC